MTQAFDRGSSGNPARSNLRAALLDPANLTEDLTDLRVRTAHALASGLFDLGNRLWAAGASSRDVPTIGMALVTQMAGELSLSAVACFKADQFYSGNALVRQLLEAHYLLAHFAQDSAKAARWATASKGVIAREFKPSRMRSAGGFDSQDYGAHCSWGGHPNPTGRWLLPGHGSSIPRAVVWPDLMQHLADIIKAIIACMAHTRVASDVAQENQELVLEMAEILDLWRVGDPLSARPGMLLRATARPGGAEDTDGGTPD